MNVRIVSLAGGFLSLAVAATMVLGNKPLAGQSESQFGSERELYPASSSTQRNAQPKPQYFLPNGPQRSIYTEPSGRPHTGRIQQVQQVQPQYQPEQSPPPPRETAIQRELRKLYEQNGQQMPQMNINRVPGPGQQPRVSAQGRDISRRRPTGYQPAQQQRPTVQKTSGQKSSSGLGFLKKLNPFAGKKPARRVPRQRVYRNTNYGRHSNRNARPLATNPRLRQIPRTATQYQPQPRYQAQPRYVSPAQRVAPNPPQSQRPVFTEQPRVVRQPQPARPTTQPVPTTAGRKGDDIPILFDEKSTGNGETKTQPTSTGNGGNANPFPGVSRPIVDTKKSDKNTSGLPTITPPTPPVKKQEVDEKKGDNPFEPTTTKSTGDPFGGIKNDAKTAPKEGDSPFVKSTRPQGPPPKLKIYSAQDINRSFKPTRASLQKDKTDEPKVEPKKIATEPTAKEKQSNAEKMRRIISRRGLSGFRGFCPVVLRDRRNLKDGLPQFHAKFEGRTYFFATAGARTSFLRSPKKYAPAKMGLDVVRLAEGGESVEGSLEHAAWYKDRLYFFTSSTTLRIFVRKPAKYAVKK